MQHEGHGACPGAAVAHGPGVVAGRRHDVREHALGAQPGSPQARPVAPGASVDDGLELRAGTAIPDDPEPTTTVARYTRQADRFTRPDGRADIAPAPALVPRCDWLTGPARGHAVTHRKGPRTDDGDVREDRRRGAHRTRAIHLPALAVPTHGEGLRTQLARREADRPRGTISVRGHGHEAVLVSAARGRHSRPLVTDAEHRRRPSRAEYSSPLLMRLKPTARAPRPVRVTPRRARPAFVSALPKPETQAGVASLLAASSAASGRRLPDRPAGVRVSRAQRRVPGVATRRTQRRLPLKPTRSTPRRSRARRWRRRATGRQGPARASCVPAAVGQTWTLAIRAHPPQCTGGPVVRAMSEPRYPFSIDSPTPSLSRERCQQLDGAGSLAAVQHDEVGPTVVVVVEGDDIVCRALVGVGDLDGHQASTIATAQEQEVAPIRGAAAARHVDVCGTVAIDVPGRHGDRVAQPGLDDDTIAAARPPTRRAEGATELDGSAPAVPGDVGEGEVDVRDGLDIQGTGAVLQGAGLVAHDAHARRAPREAEAGAVGEVLVAIVVDVTRRDALSAV